MLFHLATGILYAGPPVTFLIQLTEEKTPLSFHFVRRYLSFMRIEGDNGQDIDFQKLVQDLKTVVHDGEALIRAGISQAKRRTLSGARSTDRAVRLHPYQSLGVIFGLGVFVGVLAVSMFLSGGSEEEEGD